MAVPLPRTVFNRFKGIDCTFYSVDRGVNFAVGGNCMTTACFDYLNHIFHSFNKNTCTGRDNDEFSEYTKPERIAEMATV
jgi:hypothetical protein